jgi:hypothetical protein
VGVPGVLLAARPPAGTAAAAVVPDLSHAVALILGPKHHA